LLGAVPRLDFRHPPGEVLATVQGHVPTEPMAGCLFRDRCPEAREQCLTEPPWVEVGPEHLVRCWNYA
ncbi:MAG TPA: oligopeptide/dipeptide ABC transporter ATP-binding protein, partial [Desulfobaccales bacterium]